MKTDINGCSTTAAGHEQWEEYTSISGHPMVQYDYRTLQGELFSCVSHSIDVARARRDTWLDRVRKREEKRKESEKWKT